jgi:hypothetical protein
VSATTSPVTHVAEVAVNSDVRKSPLPDLTDTGSVRITAPKNIISANPYAIFFVVSKCGFLKAQALWLALYNLS